ncbi:YheC/YheD family protein [Mesobacillus subterraneus]|uniref:YheC/YheD family endospore coat-associated protein n=1 Tax=Mesobacillus subterraneus TaxID=285983 RepID=UPI00203F44CB|nr:YheC/YheD family protein [Mesobacillus subterraneus]MCM3662885.1 YheC/YheD family protein [Mesobacillus subterraneus]MCM3682939.1 YheC/YheD family protein [Mesobacillus subterraneus]
MRKRYPIEIIHHSKQIVFIPDDLPNGKDISKIAFGNKVIDVTCAPHPKGRKVIVLSDDVQKELSMPNLSGSLHVFTDQQTLFIGPLIGILTSGFTPYPLRPIGERSMFFAKLLSVNKMVGAIPFVFGEEHIDWDTGLIRGYFFVDDGWNTMDVPFPNVVYDRLPNRRTERKSELLSLKSRMQTDYLIPWYNPGFFSKLDVFERLQQDERAAEYLPETHQFSSFSVIERMLSNYGNIYVKPANGSLGLGIHQILFDKHKGDYYCRYRDQDGINKLTKFDSLEKLMRKIFHKRNLAHMIVQQGISLLRSEKRLIDFRVHTNKDEYGQWQVAAIAAKIAGQGSVTTHVNNGGVVKSLDELFEDKQERDMYEKKLSDVSLLLSSILEKNMEGIIGEIGFDLGIDKTGRVWLFEANSKPGRSIFKHPKLKNFDLLTRKLSLSFGIFLAEKAITAPEDIFK